MGKLTLDMLHVESSLYLFGFSLMNVFIFVRWLLLAFARLVPTLNKAIITIIILCMHILSK